MPPAFGASCGAAGSQALHNGTGWPSGSRREPCRARRRRLPAMRSRTPKARAADVSQQALNVAVLVHRMSVRFEADRAETGFLREQLTISEAAVQSLQLRSSRTETLLRQEALRSYVDEVPTAASAVPSGREPDRARCSSRPTCRWPQVTFQTPSTSSTWTRHSLPLL